MKKTSHEKFIREFNNEEVRILNDYFNNLISFLDLSKNDTNLMIEDFEKAITYYIKNGYTLKKALKILSLDNLGTCYKDSSNEWYPLDNAAKIYPFAMKESWMNVFRLSYYLKENVVPEILQIALTFTIKRFPTFRTSIRKGFFWYYIDSIKKRFKIHREFTLPCTYINVSKIGKQSFRILYYKNRISLELFHILTDGYGAVVFLSTLVSEYLKLIGENVSYNELVLDVNSEIKKSELIDEFNESKKEDKTNSLVESKALQLDGKLSNIRPCQLIHFDMKLDDVKKVCKEKNATITELMLTYIFLVCAYGTSKSGDIKVQIPVNMRKFKDTNTLRNYSLYAIISINKSEINDFDDVLIKVKTQMKEKTQEKVLNETMTYTTKLVNGIRYIPLFIKKPFAKLAYNFLGDKVTTTVLSNLGNINIPNTVKKNILKMDFALGTALTNRVLFSMITVNNVLTLTISKYTLNSMIENNLYNIIKSSGIDVEVYGSSIYENNK